MNALRAPCAATHPANYLHAGPRGRRCFDDRSIRAGRETARGFSRRRWKKHHCGRPNSPKEGRARRLPGFWRIWRRQSQRDSGRARTHRPATLRGIRQRLKPGPAYTPMTVQPRATEPKWAPRYDSGVPSPSFRMQFTRRRDRRRLGCSRAEGVLFVYECR